MTKYPFDEELRSIPDNQPQNLEQIVQKIDIKVKELDTRLCSLENLVNKIHNDYPVYWECIENEKH